MEAPVSCSSLPLLVWQKNTFKIHIIFISFQSAVVVQTEGTKGAVATLESRQHDTMRQSVSKDYTVQETSYCMEKKTVKP